MSSTRETVQAQGDAKAHSGRLLLRMPRALHAELAQAAERRGVSLNQLIVSLLSHSLHDSAGLAPSAAADGRRPSREQRRLDIALTANLVALVVAGAIAVALLIVAWNGGF